MNGDNNYWSRGDGGGGITIQDQQGNTLGQFVDGKFVSRPGAPTANPPEAKPKVTFKPGDFAGGLGGVFGPAADAASQAAGMAGKAALDIFGGPIRNLLIIAVGGVILFVALSGLIKSGEGA